MNPEQVGHWPRWLEDIYGPRPIGPRRRAEALAETEAHKREVERRLDIVSKGQAA